MDPDVVFLVTYSCPRCNATLEAGTSGPPAWLRCPACGRASLPPEQVRPESALPFIDDETSMFGHFMTEGPKAALPMRPRDMAPLPSPPATRRSTPRLLLGTGFFLSTIFFVLSLLESNHGRAWLFGLSAVVCLVFLTRRPGRSRGD